MWSVQLRSCSSHSRQLVAVDSEHAVVGVVGLMTVVVDRVTAEVCVCCTPVAQRVWVAACSGSQA